MDFTELIVPAVLGLIILVGVIHTIKYVNSLYVTGKANEWVLIINNGEMKQAGIGLSCFKGPFDQVARFPSKVNKVNFHTEQVTKEMQGIKVSGMLVWSIYRVGDGPMKAYKNLGEDLVNENPTTANENLVSMANAIVRNCISNSEINQVLTNRKMLRDAIKDEMMEVVKGWGVWLETVEITDVLISSNRLFKDMQTGFREEQEKKAVTQKMEIEKELEQQRLHTELEMQKQRASKENERRKHEAQQQLILEKEEEKNFQLQKEITKSRREAQKELDMHQRNKDQEAQKHNSELQKEQDLHRHKLKVIEEESNRQLEEFQNQTIMAEKKNELTLKELEEEHERLMKQEEFTLLSRNMNDKLLQLRAIQTTKEIYAGHYFNEFTIMDLGSEESLSNAFGKFSAIFNGQKK